MNGETNYNSFHRLYGVECKGGLNCESAGPAPSSVSSIVSDCWFIKTKGPTIRGVLANDVTIANFQGESLTGSNSDGVDLRGCGSWQLSNVFITALEGRAFSFDKSGSTPSIYIQGANLQSFDSKQGLYIGGAQFCQARGVIMQQSDEWGLKLGSEAQAIQLSDVELHNGSQVTAGPAAIVETTSACSLRGYAQYSANDTYGLSVVSGNYLILDGILAFYGTAGIVSSGILPRQARAVGGNLVTHNGGQAVFNGNGSTTTFTINHNMSFTPAVVHFVVAGTATFAPQARLSVKDGTSFTVKFNSAPPSGTGNVVIDWDAALTL